MATTLTREERTAEAIELVDIITAAMHEGKSIKYSKDGNFFLGIRDRIKDYGEKTIISPEQLFWLRDIRDRIL